MGPRAAGLNAGAARAAAAGSALFWAFLFYGLIDLVVPIDQTPGFYDSYLLETGWGVLYTFMVGLAFVSLAVRPAMLVPLAQVALVAGSLTVTALAAGSWVQLAPALLLGANCYGMLMLTQRKAAWPAAWYRLRLDPPTGVAAVVLTAPAVLFAYDMVMGYREGRAPLDDDTAGIDHWPTQAALGLAVAALAVVVAAGVRARWSGTAVSASCLAVATGWFGFWSAVYPDHAGSAGRAPGLTLIAWAFAFAGLVWWRLARSRAPAKR